MSKKRINNANIKQYFLSANSFCDFFRQECGKIRNAHCAFVAFALPADGYLLHRFFLFADNEQVRDAF